MPINKLSIYVAPFLALLFVKFAVLYFLGPLPAPDSPNYIAYADHILRSNQWRTNVDLGATSAPIPLFRMVGYPLVLVGAKQLSPDGWLWLVVSLQLVLSVLATYRLFRLLCRVSGNPNLALFFSLAQATAITMFFDQMVLTDTLYLFLLTHITCSIVEISLDRRLGYFRSVSFAASFAACFLLREASAVLCLLWFPLLLIALSRCCALSPPRS